MRIRVLGCSGGIGANLRTTCILVDDDILLDAGTGLGDLTLDEMRKIRHIFVTHSHLDHVAGIPLLVDTLFGVSEHPLTVYGYPETLKALQEHIFNWVIWPDFAELPNKSQPSLRYAPLQHGEQIDIDNRTIEMIPVDHAVPAVGYSITANGKSFAFSGDTSVNSTLWPSLNNLADLRMLVVECGFSNEDEELSLLAKHYCPKHLASDIKNLKHQNAKIAITHLKPGDEARIFSQCETEIPNRELIQLSGGEVFDI